MRSDGIWSRLKEFEKCDDVGLFLLCHNGEQLRALIVDKFKEPLIMMEDILKRARAVVVEIGRGILNAPEGRDLKVEQIIEISGDERSARIGNGKDGRRAVRQGEFKGLVRVRAGRFEEEVPVGVNGIVTELQAGPGR